MKLKRDVLPLLKETGEQFRRDEAVQLGAALSYYAMFSIFPLLLLLLAVLGFVLRYWDEAISARQEILDVVAQNFSWQFSKSLDEALVVVQRQASAATGIGLAFLLLGALAVLRQLDLSFNKIWKVSEQPRQGGLITRMMSALCDRLFSFGMLLTLGFLLLISLALTGITQAMLGVFREAPLIGGAVGFVGGLAIILVVNTLTFAVLFKYLPNTNIYWRDVWIGALLTALVWEIAKRLLALYIEHSPYAGAYGVVGTVLVLMAWIYVSSLVLFLGAEFTEVYTRRHGSRAAAISMDSAVASRRQTPLPPEWRH